MRQLTTSLLATMMAMAIAGCANTPAKPPAGAVTAEVGFPSPGTKLVFRKTDVTHMNATSTQTYTETVLRDGVYKGTPVHRETDGVNITVFNKTNRNWMATLRAGVERDSASPDDGDFSWPLFVGKTWTASETYKDDMTGHRFSPVVTYWKVTAYEDVTVPAGTFKAFKLESSPGTNNASLKTEWYAPDVKVVVKQILERTPRNYRGYGKFVTELVKIEK